MINFYKFYNRFDLDHNEYHNSLEIFNYWWLEEGEQPQLSDIENILHIIKRDAPSANEVARAIIKDRWIDAEPYIMKRPYYAFRYARDILKARWSEAEPYIMKHPHQAYLYAYYIIKSRWVECEPYMKTDENEWWWYKVRFGIPD